MSLTAKDVAEITRLLEESSFDELYLELEGLKLSLRRGAASVAPAFAAGTPPIAASAPTLAPAPNPPAVNSAEAPARGGNASASSSAAGPAPAPTAASDPNTVDVPAPMLGTFYRAPKPGAPPFVDVGSPVDEDTIIGIIEVMKLMNTVRAGVRGTVAGIAARDATLVEYGEVLMRVTKSN